MNPTKKHLDKKTGNEKPHKFSNDDYSRFAESNTFDEASYYEDSEAVIKGVDLDDEKPHNTFGAKANYDHSTGGERVPEGNRNDSGLAEEAIARLNQNPKLNAAKILMTVHDGTISLSGQVEDENEKDEAENCLRHISGIVSVVNKLQVRRYL